MLQKLINPLKVPVPFTLSHSWTALLHLKDLGYDHELTGGQINPGTGAHAAVPTPFSARSCRGISLNHMSSTGFSRIKPECAPQFLTRALFHGVPLTRQQTTTAGSTRGGILYLTERIHRLLLKVSHGWVPIAGCPLPVTDLADNATPHFYIHQHKGLCSMVLWTLFNISCLIGTAPVCVPNIAFS